MCTSFIKNLVTGYSFTLEMSHSILPERFSDSDFGSWLQYFEQCALTNSWDDAKWDEMLPDEMLSNKYNCFSN